MTCRCGWPGTGPHPCHHCGGEDGTAEERMYAMPLGTHALAGMQMKVEMRRSFLCAACNAHNLAVLDAKRKQLADAAGETEKR